MKAARPEPSLPVLQRMRQRGVAVDDRGEDTVKRQAMVDRVGQTIRAERVWRMRHRRWNLAFAVAACALTIGGTWTYLRVRTPSASSFESDRSQAPRPSAKLTVTSGVVVTTRQGHAQAASAPARLAVAAGDELRIARDGAAVLSMARGVRFELAPGSKARVERATDAEQRIRLVWGHVSVEVPETRQPRNVIVTTADTEIVVHGTRFTVAVDQADPAVQSVTRVAVSRGSVRVRHGGEQRLVKAGDSWSSSASPELPQQASDSALASAAERAKPTKTRSVHAPNPSTRMSDLAAQNQLFQAALDARDSGNERLALQHLDTLLARFPQTPIEREVRLARKKVLERLRQPSE